MIPSLMEQYADSDLQILNTEIYRYMYSNVLFCNPKELPFKNKCGPVVHLRTYVHSKLFAIAMGRFLD